MNELTESLLDSLGKHLGSSSYDLADVIPVPLAGDRMVRLRSIEEALEELERDGGPGVQCYLVQFKPKRERGSVCSPSEDNEPVLGMGIGANAAGPALPVESHANEIESDGMYLPDGKMNVPFLTRNAELLRSAGEYALARNIYQALFRSGEKTATALLGVAHCYESEGKFEEARQAYEQAIAYDPSLEAYRGLSSLLIRQGKDKLAAEALERAVVLKDIGPQARFELHMTCGNCWNRAQNPGEAARHWNWALEIDPKADELRSNLGALHLQAGKIAEAKRAFQDALAVNPKSAKALAGIASCLLSEGDKRSAHDFFAKSLEIELSNPTAVYYLVKLAYELKTYSTAARLLKNYTEVAPVNANLLYSLAGLQYHLGRIPAARETALRVLEMDPAHHGAKELILLMNRFLTN